MSFMMPPYGSLFPEVFVDPWAQLPSPSRLFDQNFGNALSHDDLIVHLFKRLLPAHTYRRCPYSTGVSEVSNSEKEFSIALDVSQFRKEDLKVSTKDNKVIIDAKHDERPDEHGFIERRFTRKYVLPKNVDPESVTSDLTSKGILVIKAPKKSPEELEWRQIPIIPVSFLKMTPEEWSVIDDLGEKQGDESDAPEVRQIPIVPLSYAMVPPGGDRSGDDDPDGKTKGEKKSKGDDDKLKGEKQAQPPPAEAVPEKKAETPAQEANLTTGDS